MKVMIIGSSSSISQEIKKNLQKLEHCLTMVGRNGSDIKFDADSPDNAKIKAVVALDCDVYLINLGILYEKNILDQDVCEINTSFHVNLITTIRICEEIFKKRMKCKIFIIGSESGKKGSFDTSYFLSKAALRSYVRERCLTNKAQQIILFSPSTISDAKMTSRRTDSERVNTYKSDHPMGRFTTSVEIASIISNFLSSDFDYISNTEIEVNGGKFARMKYD